MEMTDRRSAARTSRSDSYMSSSSNTGTSEWVDDEPRVISSSRSLDSNGTRSGASKLKKYRIILVALLIITLMNIMSEPPVIDTIDMGHVEVKNHTEVVPEYVPVATTVAPSAPPVPTLPPSHSPTEHQETLLPTTNFEPEPEPEPAPTETIIDETDDEPIDDDNGDDSNTPIDETPPPTATVIDQNDDIENIDESKDIPSSDPSQNSTQTEDILPTTPPSASPTNNEPPKHSTTGTIIIEPSNQLAKPLSDSELSVTARNFAEAHCDLTQVKDGAWYPSAPEDEWQQRAPYFLIVGVWNGGVNPLKSALLKHPQIHSSKAPDFFLPKTFERKYITHTKNSSPNNNQTSSNLNIKVFAARERMYAQIYSKGLYQTTIEDESESDSLQVGMDVSPGLLFYAQTTAPSVLCTAPWTKIIVVLRNPVDRLYRQWAFSVENLGLKLSLEKWMAQEMKLLQKVGLMGGAEEDKEMDFSSETEAWKHYQSVRNVNGAIGRSLYVFQLEQWIQAYISAGKNPSQEILILTAEDIVEDPVQKHAEVLQFLGLNQEDSSVALNLGTALSQESSLEPMTEETRKMLQTFFKPYNKRLTELLTSNGFEGDWHNRWK